MALAYCLRMRGMQRVLAMTSEDHADFVTMSYLVVQLLYCRTKKLGACVRKPGEQL